MRTCTSAACCSSALNNSWAPFPEYFLMTTCMMLYSLSLVGLLLWTFKTALVRGLTSSATRPTRALDCDLDAMAGLDAYTKISRQNVRGIRSRESNTQTVRPHFPDKHSRADSAGPSILVTHGIIACYGSTLVS